MRDRAGFRQYVDEHLAEMLDACPPEADDSWESWALTLQRAGLLFEGLNGEPDEERREFLQLFDDHGLAPFPLAGYLALSAA